MPFAQKVFAGASAGPNLLEALRGSQAIEAFEWSLRGLLKLLWGSHQKSHGQRGRKVCHLGPPTVLWPLLKHALLFPGRVLRTMTAEQDPLILIALGLTKCSYGTVLEWT